MSPYWSGVSHSGLAWWAPGGLAHRGSLGRALRAVDVRALFVKSRWPGCPRSVSSKAFTLSLQCVEFGEKGPVEKPFCKELASESWDTVPIGSKAKGEPGNHPSQLPLLDPKATRNRMWNTTLWAEIIGVERWE